MNTNANTTITNDVPFDLDGTTVVTTTSSKRQRRGRPAKAKTAVKTTIENGTINLEITKPADKQHGCLSKKKGSVSSVMTMMSKSIDENMRAGISVNENINLLVSQIEALTNPAPKRNAIIATIKKQTSNSNLLSYMWNCIMSGDNCAIIS